MRLLYQLFSRLVVLLTAMFLLGPTQLWSQNNEPSSNSNQNALQNWNELYSEGSNLLMQQQNDLDVLKRELQDSRIGYEESMRLSEKLSKSNLILKEYNQQIWERMQERDEDLAWAYDKIDLLEKQNLKHWIAHSVMGAILVLSITLWLLKRYFKAAIPFL